MFGKFSGQVHGAEGMLKTAVLSRGIDPAGALQLIDIAQTLHPGRVDQSLFGDFAFGLGNGELDVAMDRVGDQRGAAVFMIAKLAHANDRSGYSNGKLPINRPLNFKYHLSDPLVASLLHAAFVKRHCADFLFDFVTVGIDFFAAYFCLDYSIFYFSDFKFPK